MNNKSKNSQFKLFSVVSFIMFTNACIFLMQKSYFTCALSIISAISFLIAAINEKRNSK